MTFDQFGLGRDLLYLAGALTGIALGFLLNFFRKSLDARFRSRCIALVLLFLSLMIAALAVSVSVTMGAVLGETGVLALTGLLVPVFALAVRFPKFVAYPLILLAGLAAVWMAYSCLRFPALSDTPLALISPGADASVAVRIFPAGDSAAETVSAGDGTEKADGSRTFYSKGGVSRVTFSVTLVEISRIFPLVGGGGRVILRNISVGAEPLFADDPLNASLLGFYYRRIVSGQGAPGIGSRNLSGSFSLEDAAAAEIPVFVSELTAEQN